MMFWGKTNLETNKFINELKALIFCKHIIHEDKNTILLVRQAVQHFFKIRYNYIIIIKKKTPGLVGSLANYEKNKNNHMNTPEFRLKSLFY